MIRPRTSHRVPRPFRALHGRGQPLARRLAAPPMDFRPLWHMRQSRSGPPGRCLPGTFRPQGLATLSTAYSLDGLARRVSAKQRLWGLPFGAFLLIRGRHTFLHGPTRLPLPQPVASPNRSSTRRQRPKTGFQARPRTSPLRSVGCLARRPPEAPMGFVPFRGLGRLRWRAFRPTSSRGPWMTTPVTWLRLRGLGVSIRLRLARPRGPDTPS